MPVAKNARSPPKKVFEPSSNDEKILAYVCKNFSCKICNTILIQCVTLSCGHHYCSYCLDLLMGGKGKSAQQFSCCPQCSSHIKYAQPNEGMDQKIDLLINSCSKPIKNAYTVSLNNRFQKSLERSKQKHEARIKGTKQEDDDVGPKVYIANFEDICKALSLSAEGSPANSGKSFAELLSSVTSNGGQETGKKMMMRPSRAVGRGGSRRASSHSEVIDMEKADSLFGIYDEFIRKIGGVEKDGDNEPERELAGGDFAREDGVDPTMEPFKVGRKNNNVTKSDPELLALIKESEDIIRLDDHVQQWTKRMKVALMGNGESEVASSNKNKEKGEDEHSVNDELWQSSNKLLRKLQGFKSQRQDKVNRLSVEIPIPTLPPAPRSAKLDIDGISDDSDVEEYDETLRDLEESFKNQQEAMEEAEPLKEEAEPVKEEADSLMEEAGSVKEEAEPEKDEAEPSNPPTTTTPSDRVDEKPSTSRRRRTDLMEESGMTYVKENIEFITEMRKYKGALMKIQNREAETSKQIKQLLPIREPLGGDVLSPIPSLKAKTQPRKSPSPYLAQAARPSNPPPRISHCPPLRAGFLRPNIQSSKSPRRVPSFASKLPAPTLPNRPRTAVSYETQQLLSTSPYASLNNRPPTRHQQHQHLPKLHMDRGRSASSNAVYTAR